MLSDIIRKVTIKNLLDVLHIWRKYFYGKAGNSKARRKYMEYGEEQVLIWRRSYDVPPPSLTITDKRYPGDDIKYQNIDKKEIPLTESLRDTVFRFLPYWNKV